ncbi:MAG: hypothetical protein FWF38_03740 [Spirochaetaceae bacterium]|nr:hypothetical protein [Spirochaetaceae bacterium]
MVLTEQIKVIYDISGSVPLVFNIPFPYFQKKHVKSSLTLLDDSIIDLKPDVDYSVSAPGMTGQLTRIGTWPDATRLVIYREVPVTQETNLMNGDKYDAEIVEGMADHNIMALQQVAERVGNSVASRPDDLPRNLTLPLAEERGNSFLAFDIHGNLITSPGSPSVPATNAGAELIQKDTIEEMREFLAITEPEDIINAMLNRLLYIGIVLEQKPNTKDPIEANYPGDWEVCTYRAYAYRLRSTPIPTWTIYTAGLNYAAGAIVMWHLDGDNWDFYQAKAAITNAAAQLEPLLWTKLQDGDFIEQRFLHDYIDDDFLIGQQLIDGDYAGYYVEAIETYGGKFISYAGGKRPPYGSGTAGDTIRNIIGWMRIVTSAVGASGMISAAHLGGSGGLGGGSQFGDYSFSFDISKVVPTGVENTVRTTAYLLWRRID